MLLSGYYKMACKGLLCKGFWTSTPPILWVCHGEVQHELCPFCAYSRTNPAPPPPLSGALFHVKTMWMHSSLVLLKLLQSTCISSVTLPVRVRMSHLALLLLWCVAPPHSPQQPGWALTWRLWSVDMVLIVSRHVAYDSVIPLGWATGI